MALVALAALPGCFDSHGTPPGDAAIGHDAGLPPVVDGGTEPSPCGDTTCAAGEVCCSAACSVCGPATAPCPDIDCPPPAWCGGIGGIECAPDQFCDYPDGSFCGGDDSAGVCRPRPRDCPEPGGVPVCGCDGVDYLAECAANLAGADVATFGPCGLVGVRFTSPSATPTCAPDDGPAWEVTFTPVSELCTPRAQPRIVVELWADLNAAAPHTYVVSSGPGAEGTARLCAGPATPCRALEGEVVVDFFATGEVARIGYALTDAFGGAYAETSLELTSFCGFAFPGCG